MITNFVKEWKERKAFKKLVEDKKLQCGKRSMIAYLMVDHYSIWRDTVSYKYFFLDDFEPPPYDTMPRIQYLKMWEKGYFDSNAH